ncbi:Ankyrin repeat containing protein [Colletotrichum higginsianum IMI 349063]|uniref:Ankyrin repeat containing protein n=1 Tax=Colletotrichum higginsianum (strain IMI 349063) TaxID=759273 RepID=A0A1B7XYD2_COLHI|nr:Ankyrin repeat containing protein [Colletotrichum higginsianum IMI 349063]OBR04765.1 Ankyrin repeat containing protein [Colletotrichum higginsianum IMI 349063]
MATFIKRTASLSPSIVSSFSSLHHQRREPTEQEYERVAQLMAEQRQEDGNRRSGEYSHKEATPVLSKLARGAVPDATPGLAQALLDWGADVSIAKPKSTNFFKMLSGKDQSEERSDVLEQATRNCDADILIVLAQDADEQAVNQALPAALRLADTVKTGILLARGADATPHCDLFLLCVDSAPVDMVMLLIRDVKGACGSCKNKGLVRAAKAGSVEKANLLMDKGADPSFNGAAALFEAIRMGKDEVALAIISRPVMKKHPSLLTTAAQSALDHGRKKVLQACLDAGSENSTAQRQEATLQSQVTFNSPVDSRLAGTSSIEAAFMQAANAGRLDTIQQLLANNRADTLPQGVMVKLLTQSIDLPDLKTAHTLVDMLLSTGGLRGNTVANSLCRILSRPVPPANETDRVQIVQLLLGKGSADVNVGRGKAVLQALSQGRLDILGMMLRHGASAETFAVAMNASMKVAVPRDRLAAVKVLVESGNVAASESLQAAAVAAASRSAALDVLQYLAEFVTSPGVFSTGIGALARECDDWTSPRGLYVAQFLLDRGASGPEVDGAMARASGLYTRDAVQLLATSTDPASFDQVLGFVIDASPHWQLRQNLWLVHSLLEWGCKGASVDRALVRAVGAHGEEHDLQLLIDTLLLVGIGADVNHEGGRALQIAVGRGHASLVNKLALNGAGRLALTNAFQAVITSRMDEATALNLLDILVAGCERSRTRFDVDAVLADGRCPLEACISTHPRAEKLGRRLIKLGCRTGTLVSMKLDGGEERVPLLVWALYQSGQGAVAPSLLTAMVDSHRDVVKYRSASGITPLIAAAHLGSNELVGKLLGAGARPNERDNAGRTALFFASAAGHMAALQALVKAGAAQNDGSLHEAARNTHSEAVAALIKAKHEANFPSSLHEGRTALQELCYRCSCGTIYPELEDTIRALERGKADPFAVHAERNALFLALENARPYHITKAFLDVQMWRHVNDERNVFFCADPAAAAPSTAGYVCSATLYLRHGLYRGDPQHVPRLLALLAEKACQDRFFARFGPHQLEALQPPEAVGVPPALADEDARRRAAQERRRARDRDHADRLRQEQEGAAVKAEIEGRQHRLRLERQQQTSVLQAALAAQQAEVRNARRQSQQTPVAVVGNRNGVVARAGDQGRQSRLKRA